MDGAGIERIFTVAYPEEPGRLLKGLFAKTGNFFQFLPGAHRAVLRPVIHNIPCQ